MKKFMIISLLIIVTMALTGCFGGGVKLEEDQGYWVLDDDGGVTVEMLMETDDFEDEFDVDPDDKKKDIIDDLEDFFDDQDIDIEVKKLKVKKDIVSMELYIEDAKDMRLEIDDTLEDLADSWEMDLEDFVDKNELVYFKNGKDVDEDDIDDYEDLVYIHVFADDEGMYYTVPGKIILVSDDIDFKKINKNTIFVEDDAGFIFFEE